MKLQSWWRGTRERRRFLKVRRGVVRAQALVRARRARKRLAALKDQHRRRAEAEQAAAKYVLCLYNISGSNVASHSFKTNV